MSKQALLGIVLVVIGAIAVAYGFERNGVATQAQAVADGFMAQAGTASDAQALESVQADVEIASRRATDARGGATLGFGAGIVLLAGGAWLALRGRKRA